MATQTDEWVYQTTVKHGPDYMWMTNIRAYTARDLAEQVQELSEFMPQINTRLLEFNTGGSVGPNQSRSNDSRTPRGNDSRNDSAKRCEVHKLPMKKMSGSKGGKDWSGWFCTAENDRCSPVWIDD